MNKNEINLEIEYKYWAGGVSQEDFRDMLENVYGRSEAFYVVSCDDYYIREGSENDFVRYRKGGGETELTLKFKRNQNTVRKEINLNVSANDDVSIVEFLKFSGYTKAFSVFKEAWIYHMLNFDISYYTLSDGRSVIEVEAVNPTTTDMGVAIINEVSKAMKLDELLERETRSLFEIFTDESNDVSN